MENQLTTEERQTLLKLARQALEASVRGQALPPLDPASLSSRLRQPGASFVTLTRRGELRGCVGALEAYQSLAEDVREHASAAALQDYRFHPVQPQELSEIQIEISCLTPPAGPGIRATRRSGGRFAPAHRWRDALRWLAQEPPFCRRSGKSCRTPQTSSAHLCQKMGASPDLWRRRKLRVQTYQVEEFHE